MPNIPVQQLPFRSLREMVADSLRQAILDGTIGPGQKIMDADVAAQMGISRSPVREALRMLEKEGLVRSTPNRGVSVSKLSNEDIVQLYAIRSVLEGLAASWACRHVTDQELDEMRRICWEMRALLPFTSDEARKEFNRKDLELHDLFVSAARLPMLKDMLVSLRMQTRMIMAAASVSNPGSAEAATEHEKLVEAIAKRDAEAAEKLARQIALGAGDRVVRLLSEASIG
ncbi:MAG TPA: GntR family transcriptional regulator [Chloroflexota bacterium]|nr:GntR family transcriptional regulator [Chloroflexota bacterium]